jgi:hypothetical protein
MNIPDELIGEPVLIKNKIGMITSTDLKNDEVIVNFEPEGQTSFSMDAVLVLRDPAKIRLDAENDRTLMPFWDYEDIMEITGYAESTPYEYRKFAIQLSQKNPNALEYTMHSLRHELSLEQKQIIGR